MRFTSSFLLTLCVTALHPLGAASTCYESNEPGAAVAADCVCHESCGTCTKPFEDDEVDFLYCMSCADGSDLWPLFPQINSNVSDPEADVYCAGNCRELFFGMGGQCDTCFEEMGILGEEDTPLTCDQTMGTVCSLATTCDVCKDQALALIDCLGELSPDEYVELTSTIDTEDVCSSELPLECKAASPAESGSDAGATEGLNETSVTDETSVADSPSGARKASTVAFFSLAVILITMSGGIFAS